MKRGMKMDYQTVKERFLCENGFYTTEEVGRYEWENLHEWQKEKHDLNSSLYYKKVPTETSREDITIASQLAQSSKLLSLEENIIEIKESLGKNDHLVTRKEIDTMKMCLIILTVCTVALTFISLVGTAQIYSYIKNFVEGFSRIGL